MIEYYAALVVFVLALIIGTYANIKVSTCYNKYSKDVAQSGIVASVLARQLLDASNLNDIKIARVSGNMTDYYDPRKKVIALSEGVYDSGSIAALGITAHEFGHALQYKDGNALVKLRNILVPISNLMSTLVWPMLIIGVLLDFVWFSESTIGLIFIMVAVGAFALSTLLSLITLPIERDASRRAVRVLEQTGTLTEEELVGAKAILSAAGLTYVAGLLSSVANLLRILAIFGRNK